MPQADFGVLEVELDAEVDVEELEDELGEVELEELEEFESVDELELSGDCLAGELLGFEPRLSVL